MRLLYTTESLLRFRTRNENAKLTLSILRRGFAQIAVRSTPPILRRWWRRLMSTRILRCTEFAGSMKQPLLEIRRPVHHGLRKRDRLNLQGLPNLITWKPIFQKYLAADLDSEEDYSWWEIQIVAFRNTYVTLCHLKIRGKWFQFPFE